MTKRHRSADGVIHEFPDTTPDEAIDRAMKEYARNVRRISETPFDPSKTPEQYEQERLQKPLTPDELNQGRAVALANNVPFGEEAIAGIGHPGAALAAAGDDKAAGRPYYDELAHAREVEERYRAQRPWESLAVGTVPGVVAFGGAGAATAPARAVGTPASRALFGLGAGAATGGLYGFGAGEGDELGRLDTAIPSALMGGGIGVAAPSVATGAGRLYQGARDLFTVNHELKRLGLSKPSAESLANALVGDDYAGSAGASIRGAGPQGMVADAGPNAAKLLDLTMQKGGPGTGIARRAVDQRVAAERPALDLDLNAALGRSPRGVGSEQRMIRQSTAPARSKAYDEAYAKPIDYASEKGKQLEGLLKRVPKEAWGYANRLINESEDTGVRQILVNVGDEGALTFKQLPTVEQLDYVTRAMRDLADKAPEGAMGGNSALAGLRKGNVAKIRGLMRELVPEYAKALDTAADPIRRAQAVEFGATMLSKNITRDAVELELEGMGRAERDAMAQGVRLQLDEAMANVKQAASDPNLDARQAVAALRELSSDAARDKVAAVIGDREARSLFTRLDNAQRSFELRARVSENSKTATRLFTEQSVQQATEPGVVGAVAQGEVPKAIKRLISTATGYTPQRQLEREQSIYEELAKALTGPRGPAAERYIQDVVAANRRRYLTQSQSNRIANTGSRLVPALAGPGQPQERRR